MKAVETNLLKFLQKPTQFVIPIYQRPYSWTIKQCEQLWKDILRVQEPTVSGHFVGSIVYIEKGLYQVASVPQLLVIDGQQRLTTISLLLTALSKTLRESEIPEHQSIATKIENYYLFNGQEEGEDRYKLLLTQTDKESFTRLIERKGLLDKSSIRIAENYNWFENKIKTANISATAIYQGLQKLLIVDISLDHQHDNPQLIFESLNSTGLDLSQADLIRNFVLMSLPKEEQDNLYRQYWYPMEQGFGNTEYTDLFDNFMRDYLTLKTGLIPNIKEVYGSFKNYVQKDTGRKTIQEVVADIFMYSKYFIKLSFLKEEDKEINNILGDIDSLKVDVSYPFLLSVYHDFYSNVLSREGFVEILKMVESYVFRRSICGIPTNSLNKTFAILSREIDKQNYVDSVKVALLNKDSYQRFPDNEEFRREFVIKDIYNLRNRNYLLRKLENHDRKEIVSVESYTIEHILPQNENLSEAWQKELGDNWKLIQDQYLHTIGNLTLTGYNSELSDKKFLEKRDMKGGFANSPIMLNRSLAELDHWDEQEIKKRAQNITKVAINVWSFPDVATEVLQKYKKEKKENKRERVYNLEVHSEYLQGPLLDLFYEIRKEILNLDSSVREEVKRRYIAYKTTTNFVDIVPQRQCLALSLNITFAEINDPKGICRDVTGVGTWGNGDVQVKLSSSEQIEDVISLVRQALEKNQGGGE
ncbi:MAG: DUF262 and DUF1524 domain-containing protein [bacterium]